MAAGLGFKTFAVGEILSAANVNGYLMQGVLVFANATARDAAITSPQEGQFAYLKDTNVTTYYTGSAWANLDTTGMTNPMTTTGDVIYSSSGSTPARLGLGTAGQVLQVNSGATAPEWVTAASSTIQTAVFNDTKTSGTAGGTFTSGAWRTRDLNTSQQNSITGCSLASNQITLPAGTFLIQGSAPAFRTDPHQSRIYDITNSAVLFLGMSMYIDPTVYLQTTSEFRGVITLAASTVIEVQHQTFNTIASVGFGQPVSWGSNIYTSISITKVA
jgi:hypothetical protein